MTVPQQIVGIAATTSSQCLTSSFSLS